MSSHRQQISSAFEPMKVVSPEILLEIFRTLSRGGANRQIAMPPKYSQIPWVLGHVCSAWRRLSRSAPELWPPIDIYFNDGTFRNPTSPYPCLVVNKTTLAIMFERVVIPYPGQTRKLFWLSRTVDICANLQDMLPPGALARFHSFDIHIARLSRRSQMLPIGYVGLFKESSCLEELSLHSPNHNLLNLDIPWGQLVRLDVSVDLPSEMNTAEASQFLTHPGCLGKLRILHLGGSQNLSSVVLTLAFPWSQLLSLNITKIPSTLYDLLFQTLQKAVALNDLALSFNSIDGEVPSYPSPVASTQSLSLIYFPPTIFTNFPAIGSDLGALRLIDQPVHPPAFYQILRQCPHIVSLECSISSHGVVHTGNISMIRLRQLKIYILSNTWIFNPLSMPALTSLEVYTWEQLDFVPLHQLIVRSACSIQMLTLGTSDIDLLSNSYSGPSEYEPTQWIDEPLGLDDLLGSIPGVTSAHLSCVIFPDQLIHQFAHRAVLPNVETLYLATSSFDAFFSMVKLRLREEQAQGGVNLRVIRAIARGQPERTSSQLQVLNKKYGIECSFDYTV